MACGDARTRAQNTWRAFTLPRLELLHGNKRDTSRDEDLMMMMDLKLLCVICVCAAKVSLALRFDPPLVSDSLCQYGWTQKCCWGRMRNSQGQCTAVCESGCKHGECVGPNQCRCHAGYTGKTCNQDVNECAFRPCKYRCMNTVGSYKCYCLNGYMMMTDGTCRNTRTCAMANCQYGCAVIKGQVTCQCPSPGLRLSHDGRTCVDVDECVLGQARCQRFLKCVNTFGSYICRCHDGFELQHFNGKYQCTDKKNLSICYDKPGHKKCKCKASVNGKGYHCKTVVKVNIKPAKPIQVPHSPTISRTTGAMTTTTTKTTTKTTRATVDFITAVTITTAASTTTVTFDVPSTTFAMTTSAPTTTLTSAVPSTTVTMTTSASPTTVTSAVPSTTVPMTSSALPTTVTSAVPSTTVAMTSSASPTTVTSAVQSTTVAMTTAFPKITVTTALPSTTVAMTTFGSPTTFTTTNVTPFAMKTQASTTKTFTTPVTETTHPPQETSQSTTITIATTAPPVATTSLTTAGSTTRQDNRIHRDTPKPRGDVHIPRYEDNMFHWDFDVELGNTAEYTHDDPRAGAGAISCTFDEGLCVWISDSGDLHWNITEDPAGGRYLTVPDSTNRRSIRGARLTVPLAPAMKAWRSSKLCLSFRHRLHGGHIGTLQVFVRKGRSHSPSIWTSTRGHSWKHTQITLLGQGCDEIVLKGERRRGKHGEIAVDDLSLRRGECPLD